MKALVNVDWQITSVCNRKCPYCFGPKGIDSLPFDDICEIIDNLKLFGTRQIGITGGEPLLHPCFPDIINYIYNAGLTIYLSTNCDYYDQYSDLIKSKVSIVGIPVDGSNSELHDFHRGASSFSSVIHAISDINSSECLTKVKVGTVVTRKNYLDLKSIEQLLVKYRDTILFWKLYQLVPYKSNQYDVDCLRTGMVKTDELGTYLGKEKIVNDTLVKRNRSYFFIKPNGDVFVPILSENCSKEEKIGNIKKDDLNSIISKFNFLVDNDGYISPYRYMKV